MEKHLQKQALLRERRQVIERKIRNLQFELTNLDENLIKLEIKIANLQNSDNTDEDTETTDSKENQSQ